MKSFLLNQHKAINHVSNVGKKLGRNHLQVQEMDNFLSKIYDFSSNEDHIFTIKTPLNFAVVYYSHLPDPVPHFFCH